MMKLLEAEMEEWVPDNEPWLNFLPEVEFPEEPDDKLAEGDNAQAASA